MVEQLRLDRAESPEFLDAVYALFADSERREVLLYLMAHNQPVSVRRVAIELVAAADAVPPEDVTTDEQIDALVRLRHVHLPMLHDSGVLTWDRDADRVALTPLLGRLSVSLPGTGGLLDVSLAARPEPIE